jgi:hypothetical protein
LKFPPQFRAKRIPGVRNFMSKEAKQYDASLQMFVEPPRTPVFNKLRFLRFRAERGDFGYKPVSVPKGEYVLKLPDADIFRYAMEQGDKELKPDGT